MRLLLPLLAAAAVSVWPAAARAVEIPGSDGIEEAAYFAGTQPSLAFVKGRALFHGAVEARPPAPVATLPDANGRVAAVRVGSALVESRTGSWLRYYVRARGANRWRAVVIGNAPKDGVLGRAGMTSSRSGRPVIAYSIRRRDESTELWLAEVRPNLKVARMRVTRRGFPPSAVPPASTPVLMPNGTIRVVQTFVQRGANAIFWRRQGDRWWGRVLFASALGSSTSPVFAALAGENLFIAWTVAYPEQQEQHVLLTSRVERSTSIVLHRNAVAAGLVLGPNGPEVAANENVAGLDAGLIAFPSVINNSIQYSPPVEVDGKIVAYARTEHGWQLLLARNGRLEWFSSAEVPHVRIVQETGLSGRVDGAAGGVVRVYRERPGEPRVLAAEAPVAADGRFGATDPAPVAGTHYRFVYESDLPYSLLLRDPVA